MRARALRRRLVALTVALGMLGASVATASAAGVAPAKASPVQREQAQSRFLKGRDLYNRRKYEPALAELTASLDIVASPNTRLYVGRCLREMGRLVAAYVELGRAEVEAKELQRDDIRYEKAGEAALLERNQLTPKLGFLDLRIQHAAPSTTLTVGGDEVRRGGWEEPVPVAPGTAAVVITTPGKDPITRDVKIAAGERQSLELDADAETIAAAPVDVAPAPVAASGPASPLRPLAYASAGIAVAGLATFLVAGAMANGTHSDLESACGPGPCPAGHESDISAGRTQQTLANVGLVVFALAGAAGVTLFVVSTPKPAQAASASARVTAGPSFVGLQGAF